MVCTDQRVKSRACVELDRVVMKMALVKTLQVRVCLRAVERVTLIRFLFGMHPY